MKDSDWIIAILIVLVVMLAFPVNRRLKMYGRHAVEK